jgi:hypothetical protein
VAASRRSGIAPSADPADGAGDARREAEERVRARQRQLRERLLTLRAEFQEAVTTYSLRVQAMLAEVEDALPDDLSLLSEGALKVRRRALRKGVARAATIMLKPAKGRRCDLKAVEMLAETLQELLDQ